MLEGVLKGCTSVEYALQGLSFNPWYVGGGVKSVALITFTLRKFLCFNPWYVGGGVKSFCPAPPSAAGPG